MTAKTSKRFSTVAFTAPSAEQPSTPSTPSRPDVTPPEPVQTPQRPDVQTTQHTQTSRRPNTTSDQDKRIAFTWRLTPDQANQLDELVLGLRRDLGRGRLDRATVLQTLVDLATENDTIRKATRKRLDT